VESGSEKFDKLQAKGNVCHPSSQNSEWQKFHVINGNLTQNYKSYHSQVYSTFCFVIELSWNCSFIVCYWLPDNEVDVLSVSALASLRHTLCREKPFGHTATFFAKNIISVHISKGVFIQVSHY
jgi:hypothetical protein